MNLLRASTTVGSLTLVSRVFGFARDMLIAAFLGAGTMSDCFFVAQRFPNLFRSLFAEGAFSAAFVPIYAAESSTRGREAAADFANRAYTWLTLLLIGFVSLMEVAMPWAMFALAPGFDQVPGKMELAIELSRIAFPYLLFISLVSLQAGVLNGIGRFAGPAFAPVLLNLTLIVTMFAYAPITPTAGHALAWGVFSAGVVQFVWLYFSCRRAGVPLKLVRPRLTPPVRTLGRRVLPVVFGASLYQLNLLIGTMLASMVSDGAVSYLYYADRVVQLPLGVVGVAVSTALLPLLSRQWASGDTDAALHSTNRGLELALLLTLPATMALVAIADAITTVLFQRGAFSATDAAETATALAAFGIGLPAYVLIKVLLPGFYARGDTRTPVRIAAAAMVVNIVLNVVLMQVIAHVGIALGSALSSWLNAGLLMTVLRRRGHFAADAAFRRRVPRIALASVAMCAVLWAGKIGLHDFLAAGEVVRGIALAVLVGGGVAVYGLASWLTGAATVQEVRRVLRRSAA